EWVGDPPPLLPPNMLRAFPGGMPGRDPYTLMHPNRIVAYSLSDGSFRWKSDASSTRQVNAAGNGPAETEFLAAPLLVDGYLLAPTDSDRLFCIDRASGAQRWFAARDAYTHIVAASESSVWVAGAGAAMFDLETGKLVWKKETPETTGRGCLSGERLYLPAAERLLA